ncbi:MAG: maleylpyruvate isomerase family mycothiol-dependent enzyme [Candidatus Nanopelagicales bacterium]
MPTASAITETFATPATHRRELADAEQRFLSAIDQPDRWAETASGLPGWSRSHVVAHVLGNAEGMLNLVTWARTGVTTPMYVSVAARAAAIDECASWSLSRLRDALGVASAELASECGALTHPLGSAELAMTSGATLQTWEIPMIRLREVEIHHVDLAADYAPTDWSSGFTLRTMSQLTQLFALRGTLPVAELRATDSGRVWTFAVDSGSVKAPEGSQLRGPEAELLAWITGRPYQSLTFSADPDHVHPVRAQPVRAESVRAESVREQSAGEVGAPPQAPVWV